MAKSIKQAFRESFVGRFIESWLFNTPIDSGVDPQGFRRLTDSKNARDLTPPSQDRQINIAYYLYKTNPLARRLIEILKDFVIGDGLTVTSTNEKVKEVLDDFMEDPINNIPMTIDQKTEELFLYGEQIYPVVIQPTSGRVRLSYIDPLTVKEVIPNKIYPHLASEVVLKDSTLAEGPRLPVITIQEDATQGGFGLMQGQVFYFHVNKVSNATRGTSDLLALADWLDVGDQSMFNALDRMALINAFIWDVVIEGADDAKIQEYQTKYGTPPRPGTVRVHNEKVKWDAVSPDLKMQDVSEALRQTKLYILGGAGYPEHWFGYGGDSNRATALEQGSPTYRRLKKRQEYIRQVWKSILQFAVDTAVVAGKLTEKDREDGFEVSLPPINERQVAVLTDALTKVTTALQVATTNKWITEETAREVFWEMLEGLGVKIDRDAEAAELEKAEEEAAEEEERLNPPPGVGDGEDEPLLPGRPGPSSLPRGRGEVPPAYGGDRRAAESRKRMGRLVKRYGLS